MTQAMREDRGGPAPAPYSTVDVGNHASFHSYVTDANGRKIGVAWGPTAEKVWTAALFAAAPDLLAACKEFVRKVDAGEARSTHSYEQMKAAIAKAEGRP